ncbi:MAG: hypothetical protein MK052_00240 [Alphaproteobacteria bacterium]|nr:hypothetical protein [Alphaproteobacteria bacterium]
MIRLVLTALALTLIASCGPKEREDLKSPCVGTEESPCGVKRNVNDWWMA